MTYRTASIISVLAFAAAAVAPAAWAEDPPAAAAPEQPAAPAPEAAPAAPAESAAPAMPAEAPAPAPAPEAAPAPTPAPAAVAGGLIPAPPAGKGQVVFFRKGGFMGAAIVYKVREAGVAYGTLSPGKYFVVVTDPGKHTYEVHSEAKDDLSLEVDDGETYYVEGTVAMGVMVGRANISPSNEAAFVAVAKKLKLAKPEPAVAAGAH